MSHFGHIYGTEQCSPTRSRSLRYHVLKSDWRHAIRRPKLKPSPGSNAGGMFVINEQAGLTSAPPLWVVVNTHPHREPFAIDNLTRQGFKSYCPMVKKRRSHARRSMEVARPLFPS